MTDVFEKAVAELNIDRSDWQLVKFGDVAIQQKQTVDRENTELTCYVKGEHMYSEDIHLREWGELTDEYLGPAFIRKFEEGDILYGSRRTYLRKVVIAPFEGITSNTTFVIKANEEKIDKRLLPFIMLSEGFSQHSIKNSKGSVNPYVNWKDLAGYEFLLPPLRTQAELSELLWTLDNGRQTDIGLVSTLKRAYKTLLNQMMIHGTESLDGKVTKTKCGLLDERLNVIQLKDCLLEKPSYGANASSKIYEEGRPRYIRITDIDDDGKLIDDELVTIDSESYDDYMLKDNDFLFARTGNTVGKTHLYRSKYGPAVYAGYLIRFRLNQQLLRPKFLFFFTKSLKFESFKRKMMKVGAQPNINSEEYQSMHLPDLPIKVQDELIAKLDNYCEIIKLAEQKLKHAKSLQTSLINKVF